MEALQCNQRRQFVEADWRLFCTLIRSDVVNYGDLKCNLRRIVDYPNLDGYLRDLPQRPASRASRIINIVSLPQLTKRVADVRGITDVA